MSNDEWEQVVRNMVDESNLQPKESGKHRVLTDWRAKLNKEPTLLSPHKIDEIVREVRRGLEPAPGHCEGRPVCRGGWRGDFVFGTGRSNQWRNLS